MPIAKGFSLSFHFQKFLSRNHTTKRRSDFFENVHDGSILDIIFGTKGEIIKLIYTSVMGTSLIIFVITGLWLWVGPKILKRSRSKVNSK